MKSNMFAFYLTSSGDDSDLTLGYYDKTKFKGDLSWNDVQYKYMYGVKLDDLKVNGESTGICKTKDCLITFDSGTSLMSIPGFAGESLAQQNIPTFDNTSKCKNAKQYGDLTFVIGDKDYTLENDEWMFPEKNGSQ